MNRLFRRLAWVLWRRRRFGDQSWRMPVLERVVLEGGPFVGAPLVTLGVGCIVYPYRRHDGMFGQVEYAATNRYRKGYRVFAITEESRRRYEVDILADPRIVVGIR